MDPVHIDGANSRLFQIAGHLHYTLRMALLISKFRLRVGEPVDVSIGVPIGAARIAAHAGDARAGPCRPALRRASDVGCGFPVEADF